MNSEKLNSLHKVAQDLRSKKEAAIFRLCEDRKKFGTVLCPVTK